MPTNTIFAPRKLSELSADMLNFRGTGIHGSAASGSSTNIDYQLTEDRLVMGAYAILSGHAFGDYMTVQVVDVDNINGLGAGTVLNEFVSNWYVDPTVGTQRGMEAEYPAKILAGLYLRCIYTNVGGLGNVECYFNVLFHKVLK